MHQIIALDSRFTKTVGFPRRFRWIYWWYQCYLVYFTIHEWESEVGTVAISSFFSTVLPHHCTLLLSVQNILCPSPRFFSFTQLHWPSIWNLVQILTIERQYISSKILKSKVKILMHFVYFNPLTNTPYILFQISSIYHLSLYYPVVRECSNL